MDPTLAFILATLIVLILLVGAAYGWYHNPRKWVAFSYVGGDKVTLNTGGAPVNRLRFKDCVFTTANPAGTSAHWDVTAVLNGMAAAYDIPSVQKTTLSLGGGAGVALNPFSFKRAGFNTEDVVPTADASQAWTVVPDSATSLVGKMRIV